MISFTKAVTILVIELVALFFLLGLSDISRLAVVIFFPPIFAVTVYMIMATALKLEKRHIKTINFSFALLLASLSLFSTSIGFHYASNDIDNLFAFDDVFADDAIYSEALDRLYYLDELFSHWIMFAGIIGVVASALIWFMIIRKEAGVKNGLERSRSSFTVFFFPTFFGALTGTTAALTSIEANVIGYGIIAASFILPFLFFRFRHDLLSEEGRQKVFFISTLMGSYIGTSIVYFLIRNSGYNLGAAL